MKLNVLALDIEGGHGGSSRSLYSTIQHLDQEEVNIEVWCRRESILKDAYAELGVRCIIEPTMPKITAQHKFSHNIKLLLLFLYDFLKARDFRTRLVKALNSHFDVIHFNHESLAWLGAWLSNRTDVALVFHNRTILKDSLFARAQIRAMDSAADRLVFITENEKDNVRKLGATTVGEVIFNTITSFKQLPEKHELLSNDSRFKICSLSNYSWLRGIDRLVEIAEVLQSQERNDILFVVAGDIALSARLPGDLGLIGKKHGNLSDYTKLKGVSDMFLFLGHVSYPERILSACDILAKPTRESNPWGRDILESLAMGKPVISIGTYDGFVKNNVTGYLLSEYDAEDFAHKITDLVNSPEKVQQMGLRAQQMMETKCNGPKSAEELTELWIKASCA